jgi:hypothetical protein
MCEAVSKDSLVLLKFQMTALTNDTRVSFAEN